MHYGRFDSLISEGENLILRRVVTSDESEFITWRKKVEVVLKDIFGENSEEYAVVKKRKFYIPVFMIASNYNGPSYAEKVEACKDGIRRTIAELKAYKELLEDSGQASDLLETAGMGSVDKSKIFIVHGHDGELKQIVARMVEKQGLEAIILGEQVNRGATIIEKFEENSDVSAAICLFTADDDGKAVEDTDLKKRARQNVVFEAGYFMGKLSRQNVILIADSEVELPSDLQGVVYTSKHSWEIDVLRELKAMGFIIDMNKMI